MKTLIAALIYFFEAMSLVLCFPLVLAFLMVKLVEVLFTAPLNLLMDKLK